MYCVELLNGRVVEVNGAELKRRRAVIRCLLLEELAEASASAENGREGNAGRAGASRKRVRR
jgi:hypothetical protein